MGAIRLERWVFTWPVLLASLLALLIGRCYEFLLAPTLRVEDGAKVFAYFYGRPEWSNLFRFKAGYMPFGPNLIGFLSARLPVTITPYALTIVPFAQAVLAFALFYCRDFRVCVRSDAVRWTVCLAMAVVPVGQFHLLCHTDFSIWSALLIVFLLALLPSGKNWWKTLAVLAVAQLFIWSNPLSFLAVPVHLARLVFARGIQARVAQLAWVATHVAHAVFGLEPGHASALGAELLNADFWRELVSRTWWHVAAKVCFRAFFGADICAWAEGNAAFLIHGFTAAFAIAVFAIVMRRPRHGTRFVYLTLAYFVVALTAVIVATKSEVAIAGGHQRYHYVQALLVIALGVLVTAHGAAFLKPLLARRFAPAVSFAGFGVLSCTVLGNLAAYREPYPENAARIRECTQRLSELERGHSGRRCGFRLQCRKTKDWTMHISTPPCE
ncbi:MAG: hypothetical protein ACOY0T_00700 [Myxococcota bacterium]